MKEETLIRYLNNQCTEPEIEEVFLWIKNNAVNKESSRWAIERWDWCQSETDSMDNDEEFVALFDKIQRKIDLESHRGEKSNGKKTLLIAWVTRAAAILLIPVLAMFIYLFASQRPVMIGSTVFVADSIEVISPIGSRIRVLLSDGSEVYLNSGSKLKYSQQLSGQTREVKLLGEGYFKVFPNPEKPFIVQAGNLAVKAIGTSFNVLAYPNRSTIETTLVEGKVILERIESDGSSQPLGSMLPSQHIKYNVQTGTVSRDQGNMGKYIAWKDGKLVFEDTPIGQVAERLNQMFNVKIEVNNDIKDYILTVTFEDEPLSQIMELMSKAIPELKYKVLPQEKLTDDTFSKQRIIIEKK